MHSGFEIPGIHHNQHQQQQPENSCSPLLLSMNPTHILDQIHASTSTTHHNLTPLDPHPHFLLHHHYAAAPAPYFPLNFKLGLNEIPSTNHFKNGSPPDSLLRGSEQYHLLHPPFWEPLQADVSNENSEIIDTHEMNQRETLTTCLDAKSRLHFCELDAIYKRLGNNDTPQTHPTNSNIQNLSLPAHFPSDPTRPDPSPSSNLAKKKKIKKKKTTTTTPPPPPTTASDEDDRFVPPIAEFFEDLIKQVMEHQENLQKKFTDVMDRLSEERRAREEFWRNEELAHFEREAKARAHEKALAKNREALIVSYLEKITGQRINLPPLMASEITASDDSNCGGGSEPPTTTFC